ncbi:MAG: hypothetical protein APR55_08700 [Methanolinea sp. SDB]|nr:MAG: hypothetical protein APR55_08700 [Methanolinea sp. SDB]
MIKRELTLVFAIIVILMIASVGSVAASRTIPASNETSMLVVSISASATGDLRSHTDMVFQQGNENLNDNPPLNPSGEGVNTVGYFEETMATDGNISYDQTIRVDTGNQVTPQNNLETTRIIDYSNEGDGGRMYSSEEVMVDTVGAPSNQTDLGCCAWGAETTDGVLPASCTQVIAGSEMDLTEGSVTTTSSGRTVAASTDEPVELTYSVDLHGTDQTGNEDAHGTASAHVSANIAEGGGEEGTDQTTAMQHEQEISVNGWVNLAMDVSYSTE